MAGEQFFNAFTSCQGSSQMLKFFSTTSSVVIQHAPATCPHPHTSRVNGSNAVRSYFDLLETHWNRSGVKISKPPSVDASTRRVTLTAETTWTWKRSGKKWVEEFTWTLDYDEGLKIVSLVVRTISGPGTCVMRAVDANPATTYENSAVHASVSSQAQARVK